MAGNLVLKPSNARLGFGLFFVNYVRQASRAKKIEPEDPTNATKLALMQANETARSAQLAVTRSVAMTVRNAVEASKDTLSATNEEAWEKNRKQLLQADADNWSVYDSLNRSALLFEKNDKDGNKHASITVQVYDANIETTQGMLAETNEFILTNVSEGSQEKFQLFETFDQDFIYFFDRRPHIYTYNGVLINGDDTAFNFDPSAAAFDNAGNPTSITENSEIDMQWKNRFQRLYETKLRGTKCVENGARVVLTYEDTVREGYLLNMSLSESAGNTLTVPFSFTMFVTSESVTNRFP